MNELIADIQRASAALAATEDTIALDVALGEVEYLVRTARQRISDEWSATRRLQKGPEINLEELGLI